MITYCLSLTQGTKPWYRTGINFYLCYQSQSPWANNLLSPTWVSSSRVQLDL